MREVVLILQIGSLGDTVISLPCYREIARRHPTADRFLVTNHPIGSKMVSAESILLPTGLIAGSIAYPMPLRELGQMMALRRRIAALKPTVLYYLLPETRTANLLRHVAFFWLCGVARIRGVPWATALRAPCELVPKTLWESEASRLLRTLGIRPHKPSDHDRDLALSSAERLKAAATIEALGHVDGFVVISVGGKIPLNNWGDENWRATLERLWQRRPSLGAVFVGSADERERNDSLAAAWRGASLNTCGQLTPRETAALIALADVFIGHDTGTLHLAAAVDTPVVGVFSARNRAGRWFSDRPRDVFFYEHVPCEGCELVRTQDCPHGMRCMQSHSAAAVADAAHRLISLKHTPPRSANVPAGELQLLEPWPK